MKAWLEPLSGSLMVKATVSASSWKPSSEAVISIAALVSVALKVTVAGKVTSATCSAGTDTVKVRPANGATVATRNDWLLLKAMRVPSGDQVGLAVYLLSISFWRLEPSGLTA